MRLTNLENMESLYSSIRSWGTEEVVNISLPDWKGVDKYQDPVETNSLSVNFAALFLEAKILQNPRVECTVVLNDITQENNKALEDDSNKTVKLHIIEKIMYEAVSTF